MKLPSIFGTRGVRDKPKDSYGGQAYSFFFGRSTSGKNVNERTAMQTTGSWWERCAPCCLAYGKRCSDGAWGMEG